ncbi:MAG: ABC transporter permease, partial [Solobacterium sp.]|nr:ABC transporter permease [Solobacterium sp.]
YALLYGIPSLIIYGYFTKQGFLYYLISIISFLFFPLIPMVLSSLIGYFIKRVSEGKKYSNLINNALSVIVVVAIMTISFTSGNTQMSDALIRLEEYVSYIPSLKLFVEGIRYQNLLQLSFFIVISIIVFIVFIKVFSTKILMVSALGNQGYHEKNFKLKKTDSQAPMFALMKREAKRYFSNFNYVMNTAMGIIFVWIFVFYLLFNPTVFQSLPIRQYESDFIPPALLGCAFFFCISSTTSTSISLEGKTLWILKSFPLKVKEIFTSKVLFNVLLLIVPIIPALCIIAFLLNISWVGLLLSILYVCSISLFVGFFGLVMNLKFPKLEFDREIEVIKQSLSVFLMMMFGILVALLVFGLYFFLTLSFHLDGYHAFSCIIVLLFMLDGILLFLLKNWGVNRF